MNLGKQLKLKACLLNRSRSRDFIPWWQGLPRRTAWISAPARTWLFFSAKTHVSQCEAWPGVGIVR